MGRPDTVDLALPDDVQCHATDPRRRVGEQVDDEGVLDDLDARVVTHPVECGDEGPRDLLAGGVPPACRMRSRWWPPSRVSEI